MISDHYKNTIHSRKFRFHFSNHKFDRLIVTQGPAYAEMKFECFRGVSRPSIVLDLTWKL